MDAQTFAALHRQPCGFVMPNAWDAGSAILLAQCGFPAIATTSAGIAFSLGRPDYGVDNPRLGVSRETMLDRAREIAEAVAIPVNADLEAGYGDAPEAVAATIRLALEAGLAGANIEDRKPGAGLYDPALAAEPIAAACEAAAGCAFVVTARTDALMAGDGGLAEAVARLARYREAGAHCLYAPGGSDLQTARALVSALRAPLNVVVGLTAAASPRELLDAGVQRISLGGSLARAALGLVRRAAEALRGEGTADYAADQIAHAELNTLFTAARTGGAA